MAVITQNYDIDLKATGEFPVVKMSQFDTGSRTIVFTVYDGHDLARLDGMVARVDGTRSDGVEFSSTCTVSTGSKVSFTISQEMTKHAGKHAAELVIFDASGNPAGTQNFVIDVEAATMVRDSAASADDRTLYDQFTGSVSKTVADKMASVDSKMAGIDAKFTDLSTELKKIVDAQKDVRLLVFGDSWTAYYDQYLPTQIAGKLNSAWWKCYGVSGATLDGIADQIATAGQDTSFDNSTVTHIVIVGGTNNLFDPGNGSDSETLINQVKRIISNLTTYYPRAICHYFPDNSRTSNGGRTKQYGAIVECFMQFSCVAVHPETIWILSYDNFKFYRTDSSNRENLQHLTRDGYDWLAGYIAGCMRGGDTNVQTINTETSCDYLYRNEFVQATSGSNVGFIGDFKIKSYSPDTLKFEYRDGLAICHARISPVEWSPNPGVKPPASQRYALLDVNTYSINADFGKWKYANFKTNLAQPRDVTIGNGFTSLTENKRVYSVSGTLEADLYGSLRIKCFVDKGDTTSQWNIFSTINIDFNPYIMF